MEKDFKDDDFNYTHIEILVDIHLKKGVQKHDENVIKMCEWQENGIRDFLIEYFLPSETETAEGILITAQPEMLIKNY